MIVLTLGSIIILFVSLYQEKSKKQIRTVLDKKNFWIRYCAILFLLSAVLVFGLYDPGNATATFVYAQF